MKVLIIGKTASMGGTSRYTKKLIESLRKFGELDFDFINLQSYYELPGKYMKRINLIRRFPKEIDFSKYDLVHFLELDYSLYGTIRYLKKNKKNVKIIKTSHGYAKKEEIYNGIIGRLVLKPFTSYVQKYVQKNVDAVIYVSDDQREFFVNEYNLNRDRTYISYLASSFSTYDGEVNNLIKKKEKMIIFVGRVERRKRIEKFFEVARFMPDWKFKIIGHINDNAYYDLLQESQPKNVKFLVDASDEELICTYQKARYFVSFSKWENCPVSYLESISQGTPVLAFSMPIKLMVDNGVGYKLKTADDCVAQIEKLEGNYDSLVEKALNTSQLFSWEKTAKDTIEVYKDVLNFPA